MRTMPLSALKTLPAAVACWALSAPLWAVPAPTTPPTSATAAAATLPPSMDQGALWQALLGIFVVLGLLLLIAWVLRQGRTGSFGHNGVIKVIASTAISPRERVVVVEMGEEWLVLGVAPGSVRTLHVRPKGTVDTTESQRPFADWLKQITERRQKEH